MSTTPQTDSIEELAKFWDTHDLTDFEDELEEVEGPVFEKLGRIHIGIALEPDEAKALKRLAHLLQLVAVLEGLMVKKPLFLALFSAVAETCSATKHDFRAFSR